MSATMRDRTRDMKPAANAQPLPPLDRAELAPHLGECFHPSRSVGQADLFFLTGEYSGWILKDFSARPWVIRILAARRTLRREARALASLEGLEGAPRLAGLVGTDAMLLERLDATRLPRRKVSVPSLEFFDRLNALAEEMHRRGWAHGDLRRTNILIDEAERPYLIDFATSWRAGPKAGALRRWILKHWIKVDLVTLCRIKLSYHPDSLTSEERRLIESQPAHLQLGRWVRRNIYRPLKRRRRRETWERIKKRFLGR